MESHNSNITIQCPQSGIYFQPKRLNQIFHTRYDGWTFRNRCNTIKDPNIANKMKANLENLKIIVGFLPNLAAVNSAKYTELEGFDWDAAESITNPFNDETDGKSKYYIVHGLYVFKPI